MKVFDTSAVLAILYGEEGDDVAKAGLANGHIAMANVTEVLSDMTIGGKAPFGQCVATLRALGLKWVATDEAQALRAAELKPIKGLSLGDRLCIALAHTLNVPVVTSDQAWASAPIGVPVELIR